ncbi:MAG: hypothetical protein PHH98_00615 [Candidatus Gracilibacteria bacterium]|nr:hypothetical protein [Candidatus Gracilibacteria bacterium]
MVEAQGKSTEQQQSQKVEGGVVDKSKLSPEQQEVQNKIDELTNKLEIIGATEKITKKAVDILFRGLTGDSTIKTDPEAKPTIELLERYKKAFEQAQKDRKITEADLKSITESLSKMGDKLEFSAGIDEKGEKLKYDTEKLKTISSKDFLSMPEDQRLQYVTKNNVDSNSISSGSVKDLTFSFDMDNDGKINKELYMLTTAGQVLPKEVREVTKDGQTYSRIGLKGEFYNGEKRLTIHDKTNISINKIATTEELNNLSEANQKKYNEFVEKNPEYKDEKFKNIITEAIDKDIEPKLFIGVVGRRIEEFEKLSTIEKADIEMLATEIAKVSGYNKTDINQVAKVLKVATPTTWKESALKLGFKQEEIDSYSSRNSDVTKYDFGKLNDFTPAEYSYPAERSDSGTTLCSRTARLNLARLGVDGQINQGSSAKASFDLYNGDISNFPPKGDSETKVADLYLDASEKNKEYGHRVAAFKDEKGSWFVLDPYYKIGNGDSRSPIPADLYVSTMQAKGRKFWGAHYFA